MSDVCPPLRCFIQTWLTFITRRTCPNSSTVYTPSGALNLHTVYVCQGTVDREIFTLQIIHVKNFVVVYFRGSFDPRNFFNCLRLQHAWAHGAFLAFSLLPDALKLSREWQWRATARVWRRYEIGLEQRRLKLKHAWQLTSGLCLNYGPWSMQVGWACYHA